MIDQFRIEAALVAARSEVIGQPMTWGQDDCVLFVADIVRRAGGPDLVAGLEPWSGHNEALDRLSAQGGLLRGFVRAMRRVGARRTASPHPGDVGIYVTASCATCAIVGANGWAHARSPTGVVAFGAHRLRAAWALP